MAISTGRSKQQAAQYRAAKELAKQEEKQRKKEGVLGGLMSILSPVAGIASKGLLGALSIGSGGLLGPLLLGGVSSYLKKWTEEGLRKSGMGAKAGEIKADSPYGYGKGEAKTISEGLREMTARDTKEDLLSNIGMSYVSALTPKITKEGIEGGDLGKEIGKAWEEGEMPKLLEISKDKGLIASMQKKKALKELVEGTQAYQTAQMGSEVPSLDELEGFGDPDLERKLVEESDTIMAAKTEARRRRLRPDFRDMPILEEDFVSPDVVLDEVDSTLYAPGEDWESPPHQTLDELKGLTGKPPEDIFSEEPTGMGFSPEELKQIEGENWFQQFIQPEETPFQFGGRVPKYYGGGRVSGSPTISEYFDMQGKTLGGSNKQSIGQMLGRK